MANNIIIGGRSGGKMKAMFDEASRGRIQELGEENERLKTEIATLRADNERLKAKIGGPDYLLKLDTYEDTVRELMHELAVRDRQAEILAGEGWSNGKTSDPFKSERLSNALSQARAEIAKEAEVKPGTPITRQEALDVSRSILLNAEQARDEQAETEAKQGIQYDELKLEVKS